ncbi:hypothetical protein FQN57_001121 [Myotisia sp. PD_48]|nr:hypothetical protein FQN57_001121 [Myotisia sp. PD_48]
MRKPPPGRSNSIASSTKLTQLHQSDKPKHQKRSSSWSAWVPGSILRKSSPTGYHSGSCINEKKGCLGSHLRLRGKAGQFRKSSFLIPGKNHDHKKSVTIEEPTINQNYGMPSDSETVRKSNNPRRNTGHHDVPYSRPNIHGLSAGEVQVNTTKSRPDAASSKPQPPNEQSFPNIVTYPHIAKGHPRTVSRDDYLTARGANPRTGVISPSATDESRSNNIGSHSENPGSICTTQKWRLKGDQWICLDVAETTPLPTPSSENGRQDPLYLSPRDQAQGFVGVHSDPGVPLSQLADRFVVNMPSAREPCPPTMTPQQIADFQRAMDNVYRFNGEMANPETAPTPRRATPEGQSTPPKKLSKFHALRFRKTRKSTSPEQWESSCGVEASTKPGQLPLHSDQPLAEHAMQNTGNEPEKPSFLGDGRVAANVDVNHVHVQPFNGHPSSFSENLAITLLESPKVDHLAPVPMPLNKELILPSPLDVPGSLTLIPPGQVNTDPNIPQAENHCGGANRLEIDKAVGSILPPNQTSSENVSTTIMTTTSTTMATVTPIQLNTARVSRHSLETAVPLCNNIHHSFCGISSHYLEEISASPGMPNVNVGIEDTQESDEENSIPVHIISRRSSLKISTPTKILRIEDNLLEVIQENSDRLSSSVWLFYSVILELVFEMVGVYPGMAVKKHNELSTSENMPLESRLEWEEMQLSWKLKTLGSCLFLLAVPYLFVKSLGCIFKIGHWVFWVVEHAT